MPIILKESSPQFLHKGPIKPDNFEGLLACGGCCYMLHYYLDVHYGIRTKNDAKGVWSKGSLLFAEAQLYLIQPIVNFSLEITGCHLICTLEVHSGSKSIARSFFFNMEGWACLGCRQAPLSSTPYREQRCAWESGRSEESRHGDPWRAPIHWPKGGRCPPNQPPLARAPRTPAVH